MKKILIATRNPGKFFEISSFLRKLPIKTVSLKEIKIKEEVNEDGKTYQENSVKKAKFYAKLSGFPTIADDGGIEIEALNGAPGVKTRRFFGKDGREATDEEIVRQMRILIRKLPKDKRIAKFKTVVTFALSSGKSFSEKGEVSGVLKGSKLKLMEGYPYRSFFYLPKIKKFYHEDELTPDEEKVYNHRYKAIEKLKPIIKRYYAGH